MEAENTVWRLFSGSGKKWHENEHEIYWGVELTDDGKGMNEFNEGEGGILSNWAVADYIQATGARGPEVVY